MKGKITVYFGKKNILDLGFAVESADTVELQCVDVDMAVEAILTRPWACVKTDGGEKYINTRNVLWFNVERENDVQ